MKGKNKHGNFIAAYANLTTQDTYSEKIKQNRQTENYKENKKMPITISINGHHFEFERIHETEIETETGYQGHIYRNAHTGDIIVVHEGSIPLGEINAPVEVNKDWRKVNIDTLMGRVNMQFNPAEKYLNFAKDVVSQAYPNR